jgi:hypothetical protein
MAGTVTDLLGRHPVCKMCPFRAEYAHIKNISFQESKKDCKELQKEVKKLENREKTANRDILLLHASKNFMIIPL